jgi:hypothetical protein
VASRFLTALLLCAATGLAGDWSTRFDLTLNRILHDGPPHFDDAFVLADAEPQNTRRFTNFSGDVSGRYIGAMSAAARHAGRKFPELDRIVIQSPATAKARRTFWRARSGWGLVANPSLPYSRGVT